jgi:transmembrane sensor
MNARTFEGMEEIVGTDLATQALDWLIRLRFDDVSGETLSAWTEWLEQPGAPEAYDEALNTWSLGGLAPIARPSERALAKDRYTAAIPIADWLEKSRTVQVRWWPLAAAIALAVLGALGGWTWWDARGTEPLRALATMRAGHQDARLSDGSEIHLGAMSAVKVSYSRRRRTVSLQHGEALFEVAHDRSRPFVVSTPLADVTAVGTAFNIDIESGSEELFVTEGVVKVDANFGQSGTRTSPKSGWVQISAGQRLQIDAAGKKLILYEAGASPSRTWRDGRLEYRNEPLLSVIQDVNRYALHPIHLRESGLGKLAYTGTVLLSAADSWVYGLAGAFPVTVQLEHGDIILNRAAETKGSAPASPSTRHKPSAPSL